jgi:HD superfamily phosphodiesterase
MISEEQMEKIKKFAIEIDWNLAFGGKSRGNRHLFRIVKIAKELAAKYDVDISIVEAGAWLHDTNLEKTVTGSTMENKDKLLEFFESIEIHKEDQQKILHCIEAHDGRVPAETIEAKIVHDADTLEKMGPLGVIRETWKRAQIGWNTEKIIEHLKTHLEKRESRLHTTDAKERAKRLNEKLKSFFETIDNQLRE